MAEIVNDRDLLIMATVPRFTPATDRSMFLTPSSAVFKVAAGGQAAPASFRFKATLLNVSGVVDFTFSEGLTPQVNGNEVVLDYSNMSAVSGTITATINIDGVLQTQVATVTKVADGSTGASAQLLAIAATSQVFKVSKSGANDPASITINAAAQNLAGTPSFTILSGTATLTAGSTSSQKILSYANMATDIVTIKASLGGFEDSITIIKVREGADGSDAIAALLTNETHTLPASTDGTVGSVSGAVTTMKVFKGTVDDSANWTYAFAPGSSASTLSYTTSAGTLSVTGMNSGVDTASVDITASKAGASSVTKRFTVTKSKAGATGTGQQGQRGNVDISAATTSSAWADSEAVAALAAAGYGAPQVRDLVNLYRADRTFGAQKMYNGSAWITVDYVYNGNVFVKGSILPEALDTRGLAVRDLQGNVILGAGSALPAAYAAPGTLNSDLTPSITAAQAAATAAADMNLIARGACSVLGNTASKALGSAAGWNSDVYSKEGYAGGAAAKVTIPKATGYDMFFGLNSDPATDGSYTSIDYALHVTGGGTVEYWESGSLVASLGSMIDGDVLEIIYNGSRLRCMRSGLQMRDVALSTAATLYFDSSFSTPGATMTNIRFTPMSSNAWADIGGTGKPQNNATVGATIGTNLGGQFTAANISTFIQAAAIGLALIDKASITNLAALSAFLGTVDIADGGALRMKATAYNSDPGIWIGLINGVPKMSMVAPNGAKILFDPSAAQQIQLVNVGVAQSPLNVSISTTGGNLTTSYGRNVNSANTVVGYVNVADGSGNYTYSWSVTADGYACWTTNPAGSNCAGVMKGPGLALPDGVGFTLVCTVTDKTTGRTGQATFSPTIIFT